MSTIFYSWQSDLPNAENRGFIQTALQAAIKEIRATGDVKVQPVLDRDTMCRAGSPRISESIFEKIQQADISVGDVTPITRSNRHRLLPNPNVLVELGYALHALGEERVLMVLNKAYGLPERLPFDLRHRRIITYERRSGDRDGGQARRLLTSSFQHAIRSTLFLDRRPASLSMSFRDGTNTHRRPRGLSVDRKDPAGAELAGRTVAVELFLRNDSKAVATDIHCVVGAPDSKYSILSADQMRVRWRLRGMSTEESLAAAFDRPTAAETLAEVFGFAGFESAVGIEGGSLHGSMESRSSRSSPLTKRSST